MLGDVKEVNGHIELSVNHFHSISTVLGFIDRSISGFRSYCLAAPDMPIDENAITYHIGNYFNSLLLDEIDGCSPYKFSFVKNPVQSDSRRESDLGVIILSKSLPSFPIIEFEAKRLSATSNNREYVYGERGGIERFKQRHHGAHLNTCGMFGYVQNDNQSVWVQKINEWISEKSASHDTSSLDWRNQSELLIHVESLVNVDKWSSSHVRIDKSILCLYHYFIDLVKS
jgi:hypothetical protein